MQEGTAFRWPW